MKKKSFFELQDDINRLKHYDDCFEKRCGIKPNKIKGYDPKNQFKPIGTDIRHVIVMFAVMYVIYCLIKLFH
ncbi:MAG: hypothetical protein RR929_04405 [Erysipelotrichaceae bacterium]